MTEDIIKSDPYTFPRVEMKQDKGFTTLYSTLPTLENRNDFNVERFREWQDVDLELCWRKNNDYGKDNINAFGVIGVIIRMNDKMERLKKMVFDNKGNPRNLNDLQDSVGESIEDTLGDLANYSAIARMVIEKEW